MMVVPELVRTPYYQVLPSKVAAGVVRLPDPSRLPLPRTLWLSPVNATVTRRWIHQGGGGHSALSCQFGYSVLDNALGSRLLPLLVKLVRSLALRVPISSGLWWWWRWQLRSVVISALTVKAHQDAPSPVSLFQFTAANITADTFYGGAVSGSTPCCLL